MKYYEPTPFYSTSPAPLNLGHLEIVHLDACGCCRNTGKSAKICKDHYSTIWGCHFNPLANSDLKTNILWHCCTLWCQGTHVSSALRWVRSLLFDQFIHLLLQKTAIVDLPLRPSSRWWSKSSPCLGSFRPKGKLKLGTWKSHGRTMLLSYGWWLNKKAAPINKNDIDYIYIYVTICKRDRERNPSRIELMLSNPLLQFAKWTSELPS